MFFWKKEKETNFEIKKAPDAPVAATNATVTTPKGTPNKAPPKKDKKIDPGIENVYKII